MATAVDQENRVTTPPPKKKVGEPLQLEGWMEKLG